MTREPGFWSLWGMPLLLTALTIFGLSAALLGTGIWHWLSWAALATVLAIMGWHVLTPTR